MERYIFSCVALNWRREKFDDKRAEFFFKTTCMLIVINVFRKPDLLLTMLQRNLYKNVNFLIQPSLCLELNATIFYWQPEKWKKNLSLTNNFLYYYHSTSFSPLRTLIIITHLKGFLCVFNFFARNDSTKETSSATHLAKIHSWNVYTLQDWK